MLEEAQRREEAKRRLKEDIARRRAEKEALRRKDREDFEARMRAEVAVPLYKQVEERYRQEVELPEIENKRRQLEDIRKGRKRIELSQLEEHKMKYEQVRASKLEEIRRTREAAALAQKQFEAI